MPRGGILDVTHCSERAKTGFVSDCRLVQNDKAKLFLYQSDTKPVSRDMIFANVYKIIVSVEKIKILYLLVTHKDPISGAFGAISCTFM